MVTSLISSSLFITSRTIFDKQTGQDVRLSDADLAVVQRIMSHRNPDESYDMYAPWVDHFTHEVMDMPLSGRIDSKKSFIPSKVPMLDCLLMFWIQVFIFCVSDIGLSLLAAILLGFHLGLVSGKCEKLESDELLRQINHSVLICTKQM